MTRPALQPAARPGSLSAGAPPALQILTLGTAEVLVDGQPAVWHAASAQELLFYLLSFPEGRSQNEILRDLWNLSPDAASTNRLRVTVHRLRAALGRPDALGIAYGRYHLAPAVVQASDVHALYRALHTAEHADAPTERLRAFEMVEALYTGEYLPGVQTEWAQSAREEHRAAYVQACVERSALHCDRLDCHLAVAALTQAVQADPYIGEHHHQKVMTCLSVVAGPYAAVAHYRRFMRFLRHDLNDAPLPETAELAERVKRGESICARGQAVQGTSGRACPLAGGGRCPAALRRVLDFH